MMPWCRYTLCIGTCSLCPPLPSICSLCAFSKSLATVTSLPVTRTSSSKMQQRWIHISPSKLISFKRHNFRFKYSDSFYLLTMHLVCACSKALLFLCFVCLFLHLSFLICLYHFNVEYRANLIDASKRERARETTTEQMKWIASQLVSVVFFCWLDERHSS